MSYFIKKQEGREVEEDDLQWPWELDWSAMGIREHQVAQRTPVPWPTVLGTDATVPAPWDRSFTSPGGKLRTILRKERLKNAFSAHNSCFLLLTRQRLCLLPSPRYLGEEGGELLRAQELECHG
jgi:hypothetical protein